MADKEKRTLPQSTAGLVRYYDVEEAGIKLKPVHVIALTLIFTFFILLLKFVG